MQRSSRQPEALQMCAKQAYSRVCAVKGAPWFLMVHSRVDMVQDLGDVDDGSRSLGAAIYDIFKLHLPRRHWR